MFLDVEGIGKCEVLDHVWYNIPDWGSTRSRCVGIVKYRNAFGEEKQVIGLCTGLDITRDLKLIIAGGVPCYVVIS
jgi:hypothetical protein